MEGTRQLSDGSPRDLQRRVLHCFLSRCRRVGAAGKPRLNVGLHWVPGETTEGFFRRLERIKGKQSKVLLTMAKKIADNSFASFRLNRDGTKLYKAILSENWTAEAGEDRGAARCIAGWVNAKTLRRERVLADAVAELGGPGSEDYATALLTTVGRFVSIVKRDAEQQWSTIKPTAGPTDASLQAAVLSLILQALFVDGYPALSVAAERRRLCRMASCHAFGRGIPGTQTLEGQLTGSRSSQRIDHHPDWNAEVQRLTAAAAAAIASVPAPLPPLPIGL